MVQVAVKSMDQYGIDIRVIDEGIRNEYRIGYRNSPIQSKEEGKSEIMKLFQEAWERDQGYSWTTEIPPIFHYTNN